MFKQDKFGRGAELHYCYLDLNRLFLRINKVGIEAAFQFQSHCINPDKWWEDILIILQAFELIKTKLACCWTKTII